MRNTRYCRVLITGAAGFVGRQLMLHYRQQGAEVVGIDCIASPGLGITAADITQPSNYADLLAGCDLVVHAAAIVSNNIETVTAWQVNTMATAQLIAAASAAKVARFVFVSSGAVMRFGNLEYEATERASPGRPFDEDWPLMPIGNPYTDSKIAAEHVVLAAHAKGTLPCTIVRPADIYGPGCRPWVTEPLKVIQAGQFLLPAHGKGLFTPIYIDDVVRGLTMAAEDDRGLGQIFLIGGEHTVTNEAFFTYHYQWLGLAGGPPTFSTEDAIQMAEQVREKLESAGRHTEIGAGLMRQFTKKRSFSNAKARELLGWQPQVNLEEGMRYTRAWLVAESLIAA
ncbi:MAG: NAD(P)-dependent oxidoreductase [Pseudomonadota bacterium]